ncbi:Asparagine synthase (Glutamine-hydrolyzing) [Paraburkholderia ribeironis]|uniref:Asparagine synthase (Glutamine-hydrolyzing) n=1 Tax=Paraburkholderia ribeironis TaxID=1247936 RepID=A0A1N7SS47_9BURK|nr:hypothetical protein [Paraburkholderia ribeironis]SIT49753.1 Asparagine synthase (Glutamine-hydrolyzing) [Paraburkholderia ribeironis]
MHRIKRVLCGGLLTAMLMGVAAKAAAAGEFCTYLDPQDPSKSFSYYCAAFDGEDGAGNLGGG